MCFPSYVTNDMLSIYIFQSEAFISGAVIHQLGGHTMKKGCITNDKGSKDGIFVFYCKDTELLSQKSNCKHLS